MPEAPHIDDVLASIRDWVRTCGIPQYRIAELAGLHENTLTGIGRDDWAAKIETVRKLCELRARLSEHDRAA